MKKQNAPHAAEYFKFRFTKTVIGLAIAVLILCSVGIALSIWRIVAYGLNGAGDLLKSPFLILVCVFCISLVVSIFVCSRYIVTEEYFITQFGFIKSKFLMKDMTSILLNSDTNKLTVYMGEQQYFVLSIDPAWNDAFIAALRKANPNIEFSFTLAEKKDGEE